MRAIIGSTTDDDTIALSTVSKRHEMPIIGYVAESGELTDKVRNYYTRRELIDRTMDDKNVHGRNISPTTHTVYISNRTKFSLANHTHVYMYYGIFI